MIVYNVARRWFTEKVPAETYRKSRGLSPAHTLKIEVVGRADLAALLNALCEPGPDTQNVSGLLIPEQVALVDRAYVEPSTSVPDFVPLFLLDASQRAAVAADRTARGCTGEE